MVNFRAFGPPRVINHPTFEPRPNRCDGRRLHHFFQIAVTLNRLCGHSPQRRPRGVLRSPAESCGRQRAVCKTLLTASGQVGKWAAGGEWSPVGQLVILTPLGGLGGSSFLRQSAIGNPSPWRPLASLAVNPPAFGNWQSAPPHLLTSS